MMLGNRKPIMIVGFEQATPTQEISAMVGNEFYGQWTVIPSEEFFTLQNRDQYQYIVGFSYDYKMRRKIIDVIKQENLDVGTYIHDSVVASVPLKKLTTEQIYATFGRGTSVGPMTVLGYNAKIGDFCLIDPAVVISHHCTIGENTSLHVGTVAAGRTTIGNNCNLGMKTSVLPKVTVCDDVWTGALTNVTKDITESGRYLGSIARFMGPLPDFFE